MYLEIKICAAKKIENNKTTWLSIIRGSDGRVNHSYTLSICYPCCITTAKWETQEVIDINKERDDELAKKNKTTNNAIYEIVELEITEKENNYENN